MHGGGPKVVSGLPLSEEYIKENVKLVEAGLPNLLHHIKTIKLSGVSPWSVSIVSPQTRLRRSR